MVFSRSGFRKIPSTIQVNKGELLVSSKAKYLGLILDSRLKWGDHIGFLKTRASKYIKYILKWLVGRNWGISPSQACNFVNVTIVAQLCTIWGADWFINTARSNFKTIEGIVTSAYKIALGLHRSVSNKTCWAFSGQHSIKRKITSNSDKFLFRSVQLNKSTIINKIKNLDSLYKVKGISDYNIPFLIKRWSQIDHLMVNLHIWQVHPHFDFPLVLRRKDVGFDLTSGIEALESGDPNTSFLQLINDKKSDPTEIAIYTDGSRSGTEEGNFIVDCAIVVPSLKIDYKYKLNENTSSYTAKAIAITKALDQAIREGWSYINICTDSLSVLTKIKSDLLRLFPFIRSNLSPIMFELLLAINKLRYSNINIKCPAHKGITGNELADICAKSACLTGAVLNNLLSYKELVSSIRHDYIKIDKLYIDSVSQGTGAYYMNNFNNLKVNFVEKLAYKRREYTILSRIITGYGNTRLRLYKMRRIESPACNCGYESQDINHLFWSCPLLANQRQSLCVSLRQIKLQDPFSVEYLIGNLGKKVASLICNFIHEIETTHDLRI